MFTTPFLREIAGGAVEYHPPVPTVAAAAATAAHRAALDPRFRRGYHRNVLDHYERPRNVGSFDRAERGVGTGLVGAPACGDVMKLQIKVDERTGRIVDARFKTFGCGSAIAASSLATEMVRGMLLDQAEGIKNAAIARELCLPPVKLHCSMLAEDAIKAAIADFKKNRDGGTLPPHISSRT